MGLWAIAGVGQSLLDLSAQTLIADRVSVELQGRVYGAHFAWSHLWWVFAYPIAGSLAQSAPQHYFLISGAIALGLLVLIAILSKLFPAYHQGLWHEHSHEHDGTVIENHEHHHSFASPLEHEHFHFHLTDHSG
jgi:MFS transporter, NRE family, putaive nickel resistance protein